MSFNICKKCVIKLDISESMSVTVYSKEELGLLLLVTDYQKEELLLLGLDIFTDLGSLCLVGFNVLDKCDNQTHN